MTVRQVFYQLVSRGVIEKTEAEYHTTVIRLLTEMRLDGDIDFDAIVDETRRVRITQTFDSVADAVDYAARFYRRSALAQADDYVQIWLLVSNVQISGPSIKFFIDNVRMQIASWACEASCFANNPMPDLQEGLGELEIKAESLRYIVCAGQDLLADSSFNLENWIMRKVSDGFRRAISDAIMGGDGIGKPQGILHPNSGIPICDTALSTPAGQFSWQDCVMLKFELPVQWHANGSYLMNQRTFALLLTMSDANGRPLLNMMPQGMAGYQLAGSPIVIVSQFPDVAPGATPIGFGDWREAYTLVNRQATTITVDPYSLG